MRCFSLCVCVSLGTAGTYICRQKCTYIQLHCAVYVGCAHAHFVCVCAKGPLTCTVMSDFLQVGGTRSEIGRQ